MGVDELKQHIKTGQFTGLYLLYGDEDYLKSFYCSSIVKKAVTANESFNLHRFDSENFEITRFSAAVTNLPLMSDYKCIILKNIDYESLKADEWKEFQNLIGDVPEQTIVIIYMKADADKKKAKFKTLLTTVEKKGVAAEIKQSPRETERLLVKKIERNGCTISREMLDYLQSSGAADLNTLLCDVEKITAYANGEIEKYHIDSLVTKPLSSSIFDLSRSILSGDAGKALKLIDELFYKKEEPVVILSVLSGAFCDLYRAKAALSAGKRQADIEVDFHYRGTEFRIRNALRDCQKLEIAKLRRCLTLLFEADRKLKGSRVDNRIILEELIVEMRACIKGA